MKTLPLALVCATSAFLASCETPQTRPQFRPYTPPSLMTYGQMTSHPDAELFGENPLVAFQRTGAQPLPIATLPINTALTLRSQSGAFYEVSTPTGRTGWIAAKSVTGTPSSISQSPYTTSPSPSPYSPNPAASTQNADLTPSTTPQHEQIDLDNL